jgi:asparagine synthase (glutamine-hydrolysing)
MFSADRRHVLIYNGEIYNYLELRSELASQGIEFYTQCDTEVVLQALITWGDQAMSKFNGMWALAWLDLETGHLVLSRDRFGIKPLYFYKSDSRFFFASEIKAILAGSGERFRINTVAAGRYLHQSLLDSQEQTFFAGIDALPAGHNICLDLTLAAISEPTVWPYWQAPKQETSVHDINQLIETVRETFIDAVRLRLRSDVPVGVLLSGGIDSSSIAAAMQLILGKDADLRILSAVSDDARYDEQPFIDRMGAHLGCQIHKVPLRFTPDEAFRLLDTVIYANDEPVIGFSSVAHYLLMQQAKQLGVTVILSGQGADELLCGYKKYLGFYLQFLARQGKWIDTFTVLSSFARQGTVLPQFRVHEAKRYMPKALRPREIDIRGPALRQSDFSLDMGLGGMTVSHRQHLDIYRFSVPALVHYEDRMSMAFAREIRLPFLDYRLVSLLLPISPSWKLRDGWTKWIFRKAMQDFLPESIVWRKDKQGFINPQSEWLKNELRGQIETLLSGDMLIAEYGMVDQRALRQLYSAYCQQSVTNGAIWYRDVFNPIALEIWAKQFESHLRF